jgi:hypothetical protein
MKWKKEAEQEMNCCQRKIDNWKETWSIWGCVNATCAKSEWLLAFPLRMYPSILSFETISKLKLFIECGIPRPQDVRHLCLRSCNFLNPFYNLNCNAWERAPWHRVTDKSHLFHSKRRSGRDREIEPEPPAWQAAAQTAQPFITLTKRLLACWLACQVGRRVRKAEGDLLEWAAGALLKGGRST